MSTKIWYAWRIPLSRLDEATEIMRQHFRNKFLDMQKRLIGDSTDRMDIYKVHELFHRIKHVVGHGMNNPLDIESGFNFWIRNGRVYLIPFGLRGWMPNNGDLPDWFEDYHYQNQSDPPEDVPTRSWNARARMWDKLVGDNWGGWFAKMYTYTAIDADMRYEFAKLEEE